MTLKVPSSLNFLVSLGFRAISELSDLNLELVGAGKPLLPFTVAFFRNDLQSRIGVRRDFDKYLNENLKKRFF